MAPFIFAKRGNIHIIDVKKTLKGILIARKLLMDVVSAGGDVIFVGTKRQAQKAIESAATKCGMHFVSHRWLGGMLTNFRTIRSRVQRLEQLEAMEQDGTIESESKKQASRLKREIRKIKTDMDGVRKMTRLPSAVVAVDARKEILALREARKLGIATIGILDTDSDPDNVDVAIPANDDSIRAVELILNELAAAVSLGKTVVSVKKEPVSRPKHLRPRRGVLARAGEAESHTVGAPEQDSEDTGQPSNQEIAPQQEDPGVAPSV
jgi:small subunit ribosomal protein S2